MVCQRRLVIAIGEARNLLPVGRQLVVHHSMLLLPLKRQAATLVDEVL